MKIAFTSCCDCVTDPVQSAWTRLANLAPDVLILLGDNIYMDYGLGPHKYRNGEPKGIPLPVFSAAMHESYRTQWSVANFRNALTQPAVYAIWDDHDFAWNDGRGGGADDGSDEYVPAATRRLSRALFAQFRDSLIAKPATYPPNPFPDGLVAADGGGIQSAHDLGPDVRLLLLDGRSFRPARNRDQSFLGSEQWAWFESQLLAAPGVNLIASGTTLKDWRRYSDYKRLCALSERFHLLVLSGDVHEPDIQEHKCVIEVTASAMAQPPDATAVFGKRSEVFGLLDVESDSIRIRVWHKSAVVEDDRVDRNTWSLARS